MPATLGRDGSAAAVVLDDPNVSRRHARLALVDNQLVLTDLGSANGTFVNGAPVVEPTVLKVGDRVQLGETTILVLTHHDELEARMRQLQKLEAMERAVGGLAHDFNNVLTVVLAGIQYAEQLPAGAPELGEVLADLKQAASGASVLARRLLHFRNGAEPAPETVALAALVDETLAMARRVMPARPAIAFTVDVGPQVSVRGSRDELQQVLLNLCLNARDAMPDGGTLTVAAHPVRMARGEAAAHHLPCDGNYVELVVADTGIGMSESTLARAFEPFFTTKPPGQGTGLGLAMVHNIVRRWGGAIHVASIVGRGTTFRIWLPTPPVA
jgi:signal transduction histidine kinase